MIIVMLGAPGSGKGTYGRILNEKYDIPHISSGEIFRNYVKKHDKLGKEINSYILEGKLIPDELAIKTIERRLLEKDTINGFILDGYPRNENQAMQLDNLLNNIDKKINIAINLTVPDEVIIDRVINRVTCDKCRSIYNLKYSPPKELYKCDICGMPLTKRDDDTEETVKNRLNTYHQISEPLIKYYEEKDILYQLKINEDLGETKKEIFKSINEYMCREN